MSYEYAKKNADKVYILSAKHGLVEENRTLEPYNQTLNEVSREEQQIWADRVLQNLRNECNVESDNFILLAGNTYCKYLIQHLPNHFLPLDGLRMGERMSYLKKLLDDTSEKVSRTICVRLHKLFCSMPRYRWDQIPEIPFTNGIYIMFETGEQYEKMERIVRAGTHTSSDRLKVRLSDHFIKENHDGSILRKNIGKAILNAHDDSYLKTWTLDTSKPENRVYMDKEKNKETEQKVSKSLQENFTFTVFQVVDKEERLRMEEAIISALNIEPTFVPSPKWTGLYSPEREIRESGMWLKQGLNGQPITENEYSRLLELCKQFKPIPHSQTSSSASAKIKTESTKKHTPLRSKYEPLKQFLKTQTENRITLTYEEVEDILGFKLPNSAYNHSLWWKPTKGHTHCQSWLQAGYDIENPQENIRTKIVVFKKI